jgi:FlaG/FlaF family flagellin (archaellin)
MKGVSAIIAIILILMIVVALSALAYTWFSGIFSNLTNTASNATNTATNAMGMQINIEAAKYYGAAPIGVNATIRNTGTINIDSTKVSTYIDGVLSTVNTGGITPTGPIAPGATATFNIAATAASCNKQVKITLESGLEDYRTISC